MDNWGEDHGQELLEAFAAACMDFEPVQSVSLEERMCTLLTTPTTGVPIGNVTLNEERIMKAYKHIQTCLVNVDNNIDISDFQLYMLIQKSLFVEITEDIGSPQMAYNIPRVLGKRGRPSMHANVWIQPTQEYRFELRIEHSMENCFVLYSLSEIQPGVKFLPYRGIFRLIPSSDERLADDNQSVSTYLQCVPSDGMNIQVSAPKYRVEHCLVLDSGTHGNCSRFAGASSDLDLANSQLASQRKSGSTDIECHLESTLLIKPGDRITLGKPIAKYINVASPKKKRTVDL